MEKVKPTTTKFHVTMSRILQRIDPRETPVPFIDLSDAAYLIDQLDKTRRLAGLSSLYQKLNKGGHRRVKHGTWDITRKLRLWLEKERI